jgi:hypothetical protein
MSETTPTAAPEMAPSDVLFHRVYVPEFVKQCQAHGLRFDMSDDNQVADMLKIAYNLRVRAIADAERASADAGSLLKTAAAVLEADTLGVTAEPEATSKSAAALTIDPEILRAAAAVAKE